jgi:hypothetical protein
VRRPDDSVWYFHVGNEPTPNSQRDTLTRTLWRFIADHTGHEMLTIVPGDDPAVDRKVGDLDDYVDIGGDRIGDITTEEYLDGWPG